MEKGIKASNLRRLNRIEGQVRGLARMIKEERSSIEVVTQISAVRAALRCVEQQVLRQHMLDYVENSISGATAKDRRQVSELLAVLTRSNR